MCINTKTLLKTGVATYRYSTFVAYMKVIVRVYLPPRAWVLAYSASCRYPTPSVSHTRTPVSLLPAFSFQFHVSPVLWDQEASAACTQTWSNYRDMMQNVLKLFYILPQLCKLF